MAGRMIAVNAADIAGDYTPIPAGTKLRMSVFDIQEGVTGPNAKKPGSPRFVYTAKVTEEGEYKGRELRYNYIPLDGAAGDAWKLTAFADAVGWPTVEVEGKPQLELPEDLRDVLGTEFIGKVSVQADQNDAKVFYNRVQNTSRVPKGGKAPTKAAAVKKAWGDV